MQLNGKAQILRCGPRSPSDASVMEQRRMWPHEHREFEDLVGAYALDACSDDEVAAVDAYVDAHPDACAEVEHLRAAAAWIGASGSLTPPPTSARRCWPAPGSSNRRTASTRTAR